jgi:hypothetical protein
MKQDFGATPLETIKGSKNEIPVFTQLSPTENIDCGCGTIVW